MPVTHVSAPRALRVALLLFCVTPLACGPSRPAADRPAAEKALQTAQQLAAVPKLDEALNYAQQAAKADPTWVEPRLFRAKLLGQAAHYRQAYEELQAAHSAFPKDTRISMEMLRLPNHAPPAEREALARVVVTQEAQNAEAHYFLAKAILDANIPARLPEAQKALEESLRLAPGAPLPLTEAGKLYSMMGQDRQAVEALEKAMTGLQSQMQAEAMTIEKLDAWLTAQRTALFWMAPSYRRLGDTARAQKATQLVNQLSKATSTIHTLQDRANANPPDPTARQRLETILRTGRVE